MSFCFIAFVYVLKVSIGVEGVVSPEHAASSRNDTNGTRIFDPKSILNNFLNYGYTLTLKLKYILKIWSKKQVERKKLTSEEIEHGLGEVTGWESQDDHLKKKFTFSDFAESLAFINKIGDISEASDHHPDITFGWGYAEIAITTHDKGGITAKDFELAGKIDSITAD
ncbi:MAG: 4a-hydroxytetrahydrobiopterin dehydratase [Acidobacteriota bacterium]|nr:4a-hydroxytetrahydrobiopterin dehydratase [Acidobacteriota bacterium]